jgi:23S rRNA (guanosine2251-2'-O)-methyltransferase
VGGASRGRRQHHSRPERAESLDGAHVVLEALRARRRDLVRLRVATQGQRKASRSPDVEAILDEARSAGVPVEEVAPEELRSGDERGNAQHVALDAGPLPVVDLSELWSADGVHRRIVLLDGVEDPQNLGAIARVADAAGALGIVMATRRSAPLSPAASRASAGALEWLPVVRVPSLPQAINALKEKGFWLIGGDPSAPESLYEVAPRVLQGDLVVALGAEGRGLRPGILDLLDHRVRIPMAGRVASLNVSTAGAVLLFDLVRRAGSQSA